MKNVLRTAFLAVTVVAVMAAGSQAAVIFQNSFTDAEGFVNGGIGFGPANPDSIVGQGPYTVDTAGTGTLNNSSNAFVRALFGLTFGHDAMNPDPLDEASVNALNPGDVIEVEAIGLTLSPAAGAGTRNIGVFGLSNMDGGNLLGGSSLAAGVQFTSDGSTIFLDRNTNFGASLDVDTGVATGTAIDYLARFVALGGGMFDIEHHVNGSQLTLTAGVTPDFSKSSTDTAGHIQDFGQAGSIVIDALRLEVIPVPEPASIVLLGLAGIAVLTQRRS